jgi:hypothetical protein
MKNIKFLKLIQDGVSLHKKYDGDWLCVCYEPVKYSNDGVPYGGIIKLTNQKTADGFIVINYMTLREAMWFVNGNGFSIKVKNPKNVINKYIKMLLTNI